MAKQAKIIGQPGMCSDDGRALTYSWRVYTREAENGSWTERGIHPGDSSIGAHAWCEANGYAVVKEAWT